MHLQGVAKSSRKKCAMLSVGSVSYLHVCRRPLQREFAKLSGSLLSVSGLKHSCRRLRTLMPCGQCTHLSCYSQVSQAPPLPHTLPGLAAPIPRNPQNWPRLRFLRSLALPARSAEHEMTRKLFRLLSQGQYASVSRSTLARKINEQHKALQPLKRKYFESKGLPLHHWTTRLLPRFGQTGCLRTVFNSLLKSSPLTHSSFWPRLLFSFKRTGQHILAEYISVLLPSLLWQSSVSLPRENNRSCLHVGPR